MRGNAPARDIEQRVRYVEARLIEQAPTEIFNISWFMTTNILAKWNGQCRPGV